MTAFLSSKRLCERTSKLIDTLSKKLMARNLMLGTAESCTGGMIAALCTEVAGSSRWFAGGVVTYSNGLKSALLGVEPALLQTHGAVSGPVVEAMAVGALDALAVDVSLSVSGIAGPDGGSAEKPVGTVWIGAALRGVCRSDASTDLCAVPGKISTRRHNFSGSRGEVRMAAALAALETVCALLDTCPAR